MTVHTLEREQWIPAPLERVAAFFSDTRNLDDLTPRWLRFRIAIYLHLEGLDLHPGMPRATRAKV